MTTVNEINNDITKVSNKFIFRRVSVVCVTGELDVQIDSHSMKANH